MYQLSLRWVSKLSASQPRLIQMWLLLPNLVLTIAPDLLWLIFNEMCSVGFYVTAWHLDFYLHRDASLLSFYFSCVTSLCKLRVIELTGGSGGEQQFIQKPDFSRLLWSITLPVRTWKFLFVIKIIGLCTIMYYLVAFKGVYFSVTHC